MIGGICMFKKPNLLVQILIVAILGIAVGYFSQASVVILVFWGISL